MRRATDAPSRPGPVRQLLDEAPYGVVTVASATFGAEVPHGYRSGGPAPVGTTTSVIIPAGRSTCCAC
ncbi:hypothetical protein ACFVT2_27250 [Streptomyces sp. NPDC058000]|uniref:hypothetical protein n=1 Tax=Streptomyces sp. NPDC058000 TaxID=3346299 RepID=UPI0036E9EA22